MSEANVEAVRRIYAAESRGEGANNLDLMDPDVEVIPAGPLGDLVGGGVYQGHDGLRRFYRAYYDAWEHVDYEVDELIDAGEHVVCVVTNRGRGRTSGIALEWTVFGVWTFKAGRIVRVKFGASRDEALEAVGLSE